MIDKIKQYAKFVAAIIGAVAVSFAGLLPAEWAPWIQAVIALLTAISVLAVPNALTSSQDLALALRTPSEVNADAQAALARAGYPPVV